MYLCDCHMGNGVTTRKHLPLYPWLLSKVGDGLNPFNGRVLCFAEPLEMKPWILCINSEKGKWLWIIEWEECGFLKNSLRGREWGKTELKETSKLQKPRVLPSRLSEVHTQRKRKSHEDSQTHKHTVGLNANKSWVHYPRWHTIVICRSRSKRVTAKKRKLDGDLAAWH